MSSGQIKVRIGLKDIKSYWVMVLTLLVFVTITYFATEGIMGLVLSTMIFAFLCLVIIFFMSKKNDLSCIVAIPIMLSVFQNVYLGFFSPQLNETAVKLLTILNFIVAVIIFIFLCLRTTKLEINESGIFNIMILLTMCSLFSIFISSNKNVISIISSFRNIISVFLFYFIGKLSNNKMNGKRFEKIVLFFSFFVLIIGIIDVLTGFKMWNVLNISDLWEKKGISLQSSGLPTNFFSSETIKGVRIRRMVSTFADPVNLGTFLFGAFCIAWRNNIKFIKMLLVIGMILTVSKGALLGLLIFFCVYAFYKFPRSIFYVVTFLSAICGLFFLLYASRNSANSVFLHIFGLLAAFKGLAIHPLGTGLGSNGVLAKQFSGLSANSSVTETGLGMIISQLGILGLLLYMFFFIKVIKQCLFINNTTEKIMSLTLTFSIIANIFFNEVALSPNSCAIYFILIGYYCNKERKY